MMLGAAYADQNTGDLLGERRRRVRLLKKSSQFLAFESSNRFHLVETAG